jgi:tRNA-specific 2-thiouridylase
MGIAAQHPLYVTGINKKTNSITVGEKKDVYGKELIAGDVNLVGIDSISKPLKVYAKIRYKHPAAPATVEPFDAKQPPQPAPSPPGEKEKETTKFPLPLGERDRVRGEKGKILVRFEKPQWAITPGQAVVFYRKNLLLGGGFIKKRL